MLSSTSKVFFNVYFSVCFMVGCYYCFKVWGPHLPIPETILYFSDNSWALVIARNVPWGVSRTPSTIDPGNRVVSLMFIILMFSNLSVIFVPGLFVPGKIFLVVGA